MGKGDTNHLTYVDHLEELRWRIIRVLFFLIFNTVISFVFTNRIVFYLQEPIRKYSLNLHYFKPYEKFLTYIKISFYMGLVITIPIIILQGSLFVYPALRKNEKKYIILFALVIPVLFLGGSLFSYKLIAPLAFKFFVSFASGDNVLPVWGFSEYYNLLFMMVISLGILFQTPLILIILIKMGILNASTLAKYRLYIIFIVAIIAAIASPPDIISQILLGLPIYLLIEITIFFGKFL